MTSLEQQDQLVCDRLSEIGIDVPSVYSLVNSQKPHDASIPILIECLSVITNPRILEGIIRALTTPKATGLAGPALLDLFDSMRCGVHGYNQSFAWSIGNAMTLVSTQDLSDRITKIALDDRIDKPREMFITSLGRMSDDSSAGAIYKLLDDPVMCGYAVLAARKRKLSAARNQIEQLLQHPKAWIRSEAAKALKSIP